MHWMQELYTSARQLHWMYNLIGTPGSIAEGECLLHNRTCTALPYFHLHCGHMHAYTYGRAQPPRPADPPLHPHACAGQLGCALKPVRPKLQLQLPRAWVCARAAWGRWQWDLPEAKPPNGNANGRMMARGYSHGNSQWQAI